MYFSKAVIATVIATGSVLGAPVDSSYTTICDPPCEPISTPEPCVDGCDTTRPPVSTTPEPEPTPECEGSCETEENPCGSSCQTNDPVDTSTYFQPCSIWQYNVKNGAISSASTGLVSKSNTNAGADTTTLVTFQYPEAASGRQCQFAFYFDATAAASGSRKMDLFTTNGVAPGPTTGWGPGNRRNIHLGRLDAAPAGSTGFATWEATYNAYLTAPTDCKAPGTEEGFELVGVYDEDYIWWDPSTGAGPRIIIS
ncbi:hypothetical protein HJFPF1_12561 [Paramyrothecium foliicola]|nr:hypothetical protein HJFPF1_12561 [Paramyrothecium foliicola]